MAGNKAYREAQRKIEEARRSGATELDLGVEWNTSGNVSKLAELPESLRHLTQLRWLDVSRNELTELPEYLGQLQQLQKLRLNGNQLTMLPPSLGQLEHLQELNLDGNQLTTLPESLVKLERLTELSLGDNQFTALPDCLARLAHLESLTLSSNRLRSLPEWLWQLSMLRSLNLQFNQIEALPERLGQLTRLETLSIYGNLLTVLPESVGHLTQLRELNLGDNKLTLLPDSLGRLKLLDSLDLTSNPLLALPETILECVSLSWLNLMSVRSVGSLAQVISRLTNLKELNIWYCKCKELPAGFLGLPNLTGLYAGDNEMTNLPAEISQLTQLRTLNLDRNQLTTLPESLVQLEHLESLILGENPLNPELAAAYNEGLDAVKRYLRAKSEAQVVLNEAKLILIGEGEVGKSCLLGALRGDEFIDGRPTTHGIEIKAVNVTDPDTGTEITLNGWDFGGQRVYRPTHQLFFSAPAVYLVVWKPREGPQQGFVKEWISLVKHREPEARILVVATHGGPGERQPDIGKQELWDLFGRDTVLDFFHVDSRPNIETGERAGIAELKDAIARVAASLPEMGRAIPARWQDARETLKQIGAAYLPLEQVLEICHEHKIVEDEANDFVRISHRLGHLIHYEHDPVLQDIVILKPDWLTTAISFVLDDKQTRDTHGLVSFERLSRLWNDPVRGEEFCYPPDLHPVFLRLMERFDLSYRVSGLRDEGQQDATSLIAQLVPDVRPDPIPGWVANVAEGDEQQVQICQIVETQNGQTAAAEGLFYQLIVRLHKYSMGRVNYEESAHWQRGLVLDDDYNGRALLEYIGDDVRITVRAAYPEGFLSVLTHEVKWLVESFWAGLRCDVMVPCIEPCGKSAPGTGLFEVQKLIASKKRHRPEYPCPVCNEWQSIDYLLRNAPAIQRLPGEELLTWFAEVKGELSGVRELLIVQHGEAVGRFDKLDTGTQRILSKVDDAFIRLMQTLTDEAKDGPRLFSFQPVDSGFFDKPKWISQKFRLTLWCEHSRLPLPGLNREKDKHGVYELDLARDWFVKAAPFLKVITSTLSLILPVASSVTKLVMDDTYYKGIEKELELGNKSIESAAKGLEKAEGFIKRSEARDLEQDKAIRAQGAILRQLHALLKEKDPSFGGLVRVRNKRQEFLWVHPQFEKEY